MNKFEEIINNTAQKPTAEQIRSALEETIKSFVSLKDLNEFLIKLHPSDAYKAIRDIVHPKTNIIIKREQQDKTEDYTRFQEIKQEAKRIFNYEHKTATIFDVQQISTSITQQISQQMYGIAIRMISKLDDELGKVEQAINTIEGHIGLNVTNFVEEENNNDTAESGNEQRSKEVINRTGDTCNTK